MKKNTIALCIAALSLSATAGMVNANQNAAPTQQQSVEMTDAKLLKFSIAMDSISQINTKYEAKFQGVEDAEQAQKIQQQAQSEMVEAVESAGLSVAEYSTIAQQAQQDEQLRERILNMSRAE
ncbi:DUF4168 domain-containing protein [Pseudoalteromonas mariniglutinosa]|uniref:DUF4168 domain-containing protein n=1 Tax=Pseudoalteromonas mariniglutinosa TaxID=206042 RepID=UPI00384E89A1